VTSRRRRHRSSAAAGETHARGRYETGNHCRLDGSGRHQWHGGPGRAGWSPQSGARRHGAGRGGESNPLSAGATVGSSRRAAVSFRRHKSPVTGLAEMPFGLRPSGRGGFVPGFIKRITCAAAPHSLVFRSARVFLRKHALYCILNVTTIASCCFLPFVAGQLTDVFNRRTHPRSCA